MNEVELEKHEKYIENVNNINRRQYYLLSLKKNPSQNNNQSNGTNNGHKVNPNALAHDYLESDFRDKILDIEEQIYNGGLGSLKVIYFKQ
jgi:hypothetical protein